MFGCHTLVCQMKVCNVCFFMSKFVVSTFATSKITTSVFFSPANAQKLVAEGITSVEGKVS